MAEEHGEPMEAQLDGCAINCVVPKTVLAVTCACYHKCHALFEERSICSTALLVEGVLERELVV